MQWGVGELVGGNVMQSNIKIYIYLCLHKGDGFRREDFVIDIIQTQTFLPKETCWTQLSLVFTTSWLSLGNSGPMTFLKKYMRNDDRLHPRCSHEQWLGGCCHILDFLS